MNEEVSRDMTGEADGKNPGVDSTDGVMHIWMSDLWFSMTRWLVGEKGWQLMRSGYRSTWSTSVHQSQTFLADVIYGQPLDITWLYHVTGSALSVVRPSLLQVRQSGTCYQTVSATWQSPATASDNLRRRICFVFTTQHTQRSRDASWLCAI